ncbi:MAG TPA: glycosyltransferase [Terracidiphilus sp.]|jgi:glycosyltransferase involved in cell wall biosynthesis
MGKLVFVWDNFGPLHADRCNAVAKRFDGRDQVIGLELAGRSKVYDWLPEDGTHFRKVTLVGGRTLEEIPFLQLFEKTLSACLSMGRGSKYFLCHYQEPAIFLVAGALRLLGRKVYTMGCSKFDDYTRNLPRELIKSFMYLPYNGAISSGIRAQDYMRFMGFSPEKIASPYNTVSLDRIRDLSGAPAAPEGVPFRDRHFTIVARMVAKKNISMALTALKLYAEQVSSPRALHIFGTGPLEAELRHQVREAGITELVHFRGFLQTEEISRAYGSTLALLLPSIEEQFGNVVPEAQAMGLPIILSDNCGSRDVLVRSGVNGFVIEPDNPNGLAFFMKLLSEDESLWRSMCFASQQFVQRADTDRFAEAVEALAYPTKHQ